MKRILLVFLLALSAGAFAAPMTNDDVIKLVRSGVGDALVIQTIDSSEPFFDTSVDGIVRLKQSGVSDAVIQKMMSKRPGAAPAPAVPAAAPAPAPAPAAGAPAGIPPQAICRECGVIDYVREVQRPGQATGGGAVAGGVAGAVVGRGVSNQRNRTLGTVAGGVLGAVAGHQIERSVSASRYWEIVVRFDDGAVRTFSQEQQPYWRQGDRVRLTNGVLGPI